MSDIYSISARPYSFSFDPKRTALIIIDMQNDFCSEGGFVNLKGFDIKHTREPIKPILAVLNHVRETSMTVIHTREGHRQDLVDCPTHKLNRSKIMGAEIGSEGPLGPVLTRGSMSHDFVDELQPLEGEVVIDKSGKDAFIGTELELILRRRSIQKMIFAGVTTDCCVHSTLRHANDLGYECLILEDCCASYVPEFHKAAIRMILPFLGSVSNSTRTLEGLLQL